MEFILDLLSELVSSGASSLSVHPVIRVGCRILITLFFLCVFALLIVIGISMWKENPAASLTVGFLTAILFFLSIKKAYHSNLLKKSL